MILSYPQEDDKTRSDQEPVEMLADHSWMSETTINDVLDNQEEIVKDVCKIQILLSLRVVEERRFQYNYLSNIFNKYVFHHNSNW